MKKCPNCGCEDKPQNYFDVHVIQESKHIENNDNIGREKFWEDLGRP
jgi:RNA polymerase subunit RPABC4/transcription elongation factor Spt4